MLLWGSINNMNKLKSKTSLSVVLLFFLTIFGFILRVLNLTILPVFADEAIYVRWAQVMKAEASLRFLPLTDGKQPLYMWTLIPFFKIFHDPLFAGRLLSVLCGSMTIVGLFVLAYLLFKSKKVALISALFYAISPFSFFFDRMALVDSMLCFFSVWYLVFLTVSVTKLRWDFSMLAGFALGGALLTKSPGIFFLLLMPASIFLLKFPEKNKEKAYYFARVIGLWVTTAVIGFGLYQILRLGPDFSQIASRNQDYIFPLSHILDNPKDPFLFLVDRALEWISVMGPFWILILAFFGILNLSRKHPGKLFFLMAFWVGPLLVNAMYAKVFTARYILYTLPPLFLLASSSFLISGKLKYVLYSLLALFVGHALIFDYLLITNPPKAPLVREERSGYLEEWTAGTGIKEVADYLRAEHDANPNEKIVVGTEGYFGTLPDGLQIYLEKVPNIVIFGSGLNFGEVPQSLIDSKNAGNKTYFVVNSSRLNFKDNFEKYGLKVVLSFAKASRADGYKEFVQYGDHDTFYLFEVTGEKSVKK